MVPGWEYSWSTAPATGSFVSESTFSTCTSICLFSISKYCFSSSSFTSIVIGEAIWYPGSGSNSWISYNPGANPLKTSGSSPDIQSRMISWLSVRTRRSFVPGSGFSPSVFWISTSSFWFITACTSFMVYNPFSRPVNCSGSTPETHSFTSALSRFLINWSTAPITGSFVSLSSFSMFTSILWFSMVNTWIL